MGCGSSQGPEKPPMVGEGVCTNPRPRGCSHKCQLPPHRGECPPCKQRTRKRCYCDYTEKRLECYKWNHASTQEREAMLSCGERCHRTLQCGHRCQLECHPGSCPLSSTCVEEVQVACKCGRKRAQFFCREVQSGDGLQCDLTCEEETEEKEQTRKVEEQKQMEARQRTYVHTKTESEINRSAGSISLLEQFKQDRGKDFFKEFPTPSLLAEAQSAFTSLNWSIPEEKGIRTPYPTPSLKDDVFRLEDCTTIDSNAAETEVEACFVELETLVAHLISPTRSDIGRVRAIFRWIAAQDVTRMEFTDREASSTAAYYLARIKAELGGYPELFSEMCRLANIPCVTITGYVKGVHYEPGKTLESQSGTWSAVYVGDSWRFVDAHWGSRHVSGSDTGEYELVDDGSGRKNPSKAVPAQCETEYQYNEFYFLTDPHHMIYSHCPNDEAWQLLARPVSLEEFRDMALLKPSFFGLHLDVDSHPRCGLKAENGACLISIRLPPSGGRRFMYHLYRAVKSESITTIGNVSLDRYVFLEKIQDKSIIQAQVNFPTTGKFKLQLYSQNSSVDVNNYKCICAYSIYCDEVSEVPPEPFPFNTANEWGPGTDLRETGFLPVTHTSGVVETEDGEVELRFRLEKDMEFLHKFFRDDPEETKYQSYVFHRYEGGDVIFRVKVPDKGKYALNLYAKEVGQNASFSNICNYMVEGDAAPDNTLPFPEITNGRVGPTDTFHDLGIRAEGPVSEGFFTVGESGELELKFELSQPVSFIPQLHLQTTDGEKDYSKYSTHVTEGDSVTFYLRFPETGMYKFSVFGKSPFHEGNYPSLYRALIQVNYPQVGGFPFPRKLEWKSSYQILEPDSGYLPMNEKVRFLAKIPDADKVTVIDDNWTHLRRNDQGLWEGQFETGETEKDVKLSASLAPNSDSYSTLLLYQVLSKEKLEEIRQSQEQQAAAAHEKMTTEHSRLQSIEEMSGEDEQQEGENVNEENQGNDEEDEWTRKMLQNNNLHNEEEELIKREEENKRNLEESERKKQNEDERKKRKEQKKKKREEVERRRQEEEEQRKREKEGRKQEEEKQRQPERDSDEDDDANDEWTRKEEEHERKKKERQEEDGKKREEEGNERKKRREERKRLKEKERQKREEEERSREEERKKREEERKKKDDRNRREAEEELRILEEEEIEAKRQAAELDRKIAKAKSQADKEEMEKQQKHSKEQRDHIARERLKAAMRNEARFTLQAAIDNFKKRDLKQKNGELDEAETMLDMLIIRDDLRLAVAGRDVQEMKDIIAEIENRGYQVRLSYDVGQAKNKIYSIEKMSQFNTAILDMDAKIMTEIRRYNNPPDVVHQVFIATLLLLGKHEGLTRRWKKCQKYCNPHGPDGLKSQVINCDVDQIHPEIAARAGQIIDDLEVEQVRQRSAGAATFYVWCKGMVEEVRERTEEDGDDEDEVEPANKARQKEIFRTQQERNEKHSNPEKNERNSKSVKSERNPKPSRSERNSKSPRR